MQSMPEARVPSQSFVCLLRVYANVWWRGVNGREEAVGRSCVIECVRYAREWDHKSATFGVEVYTDMASGNTSAWRISFRIPLC